MDECSKSIHLSKPWGGKASASETEMIGWTLKIEHFPERERARLTPLGFSQSDKEICMMHGWTEYRRTAHFMRGYVNLCGISELPQNQSNITESSWSMSRKRLSVNRPKCAFQWEKLAFIYPLRVEAAVGSKSALTLRPQKWFL